MTAICGSAATCAHQCMLDTVGEERAVRELRDGIVERLVGELLLECLAFADVAAVEDDAPDVLVVKQVGVLDLERQRRPVAVADRALHGVCVASPVSVERDQLSQQRTIVFAEQSVEALAFDLVGGVAEDALDRGALVRDDALRVEHGDQVARVRDERAEACFALAPVQVGGQRGAFDGQRDLCGERTERVDEITRHRLRGRDNERTPDVTANREWSDDGRMSLRKPEVAAHMRR